MAAPPRPRHAHTDDDVGRSTRLDPARVLILACGRNHHRDDSVGLLVGRRLEALLPPGVRLASSEAPGADLPLLVGDTDLLLLIDAARMPRLPVGRIVRIDFRADAARLRGSLPRDTHTLDVQTGLLLCDALGILPPHVWIYAIAIRDASFGDGLTPRVAAAVPRLARHVLADVHARVGTPGDGGSATDRRIIQARSRRGVAWQ